ncbi:hypothetical protein BDQ17DRAFT_1404067 [Cyathus striatus]|nr:hypothetical protein BDQ17DRAFT_1416828 [Cyathus striatus]KAF9005182.1 hypothetical protein BDQ17DRAFT_1325325 [Cyathus striatus]KAF9015452.1 hypothetical protein BDQ17DRAFT_1404067 [Cyathus striatus]
MSVLPVLAVSLSKVVPEELSNLSLIEESMISRCRAKACIVQLRESNQNLQIPTIQRGIKGHVRDVHSKLRPGTLVTIEAKMICWLNTDRMKPHTLRKNYHLQIVKVRVFADSDLPMHPLDTPKVLSPPSPESSKTPAKRELASDKFTTFSATPVKKSKK